MNRTADIAQLEGRSIALGAHRFDAEGIIAFAREFDYQPFHLSEEEAAQTHFGALAASGWQTAGGVFQAPECRPCGDTRSCRASRQRLATREHPALAAPGAPRRHGSLHLHPDTHHAR